ncbi:hypothetical protein D3C81_2026380 [compost metagenome]
MPCLVDQALGQLAAQGLAAADYPLATQGLGRGVVQQHAPGRRCRLDHAHRLLLDHPQQGEGVFVLLVGQ